MKNITSKILFLIVVASLTACGSTPYVPPTEYPTVKVHSEEMYEWSSDDSYAKNIALMVQPSGIGFGVDDMSNPTDTPLITNNGVITDNESIGSLELTTSFIDGGIGGALLFSMLDNTVKKQNEWTPILVDFMPVADLPNPHDKGTYLTIRNMVSNNIRTALEKEHPNMEWKGAYFNTNRWASAKSKVFFNDLSCGDAYNIGNTNGRYPLLSWATQPELFENSGDSKLVAPYCGFTFESSMTGKVTINGIEHWIIVSLTSKASNSPDNTYYMQSLNESYPGHILNPIAFRFYTLNSDLENVKRRIWVNKYPFVSYKGTVHLFDIEDTGTKLQF